MLHLPIQLDVRFWLGRLEAAVAATPSRVQARLHELLLRSGFEGQVRADPFWAQGEAMY